MLPIGALAFSAVNALAEEGVYRGCVMEALDAAMGRGLDAAVLVRRTDDGFQRVGQDARLVAATGGLLAAAEVHVGAEATARLGADAARDSRERALPSWLAFN